MKLYFGDKASITTTILVLVTTAFVVESIVNRNNIHVWGRRTAILLILGLYICTMAATRDGLHLTIQHAIDGSCDPGIFPLISVPNILGCVGALVIIVSGVMTPFVRSQNTREILFYMMSGGMGFKVLAVEICRIIR